MDNRFDRTFAALGGAGLGAGLIYLLDSQAGARRRARLRDKAMRAVKQAGDALGMVAADVAGRSHGIRPRLRHVLVHESVDDRVLMERVRAKLGRYVSHPRSIGVIAQGGKVTLTGPIIAKEAPGLLASIRRVPGVLGVENALTLHENPAGVPGLQGGGARKGARFELLQVSWSPAVRFAAAGAGIWLLAGGAARGGARGWLSAAAGLGFLSRAWFNEPLPRILGIGYGPAAVRLQKTINIDAPPDFVFRIFASYDNFPLFMPHVQEVRDLGEGRSHWKVKAVPGASVEWDAEITELIADRSLGWTSLPGSTVPNAGIIHFSPNAKGGTTVDIKLGYHPPAGEVGHAFARLLGADPKTRLDQDLLVMKGFIERQAAAAIGDGTVASAGRSAPAGGSASGGASDPASGQVWDG